MSESMQFAYLDPRQLVKNKWNPNQVTPEAEVKLKKSIEENGHIRPILVREIVGGQLEIVGGEHRVDISIELGMDTVPVLNLGAISDHQAKKALMLDNSRYGEDDVGLLSDLLSELGSASTLSEWMNMDEGELEVLVGVADESDDDLALLDSLDTIDDEDDHDDMLPAKELQTHQVMKFKVPVENAEFVKSKIDAIVREQGLEDSDAQVRAGDALVWACRELSQGDIDDELVTELEELEFEHD